LPELMTELHKLTTQQLRKIIPIKEQIESLEAEMNAITGSEAIAPAKAPGKRKMSAFARAAIGAAQKARWAKVKAGKGKTAPKKRRKISAAGRARIAAAAKARWAKVKAAGKKRL
jgi:hypothetical protein